MPGPVELVIYFLLALVANFAWRYLERGVDWLEARTRQTIPRFRGAARQQGPYLWVMLLGPPLALGLIILAALRGYWLTVAAASPSVVGGFAAGFALSKAQQRAWIPAGVEHIILGLALLILAGLVTAQMALEVSPWFGFAAIGMAPWGIMELSIGVRVLRSRAGA